MQALNVAGDRGDVFITQALGNGLHGHRVTIVGTAAFFLAEIGELFGDVRSVLATQVREAGSGVAGAIGRVATGAGWQRRGRR